MFIRLASTLYIYFSSSSFLGLSSFWSCCFPGTLISGAGIYVDSLFFCVLSFCVTFYHEFHTPTPIVYPLVYRSGKSWCSSLSIIICWRCDCLNWNINNETKYIFNTGITMVYWTCVRILFIHFILWVCLLLWRIGFARKLFFRFPFVYNIGI